jgi:N-formylglutamate deformylase
MIPMQPATPNGDNTDQQDPIGASPAWSLEPDKLWQIEVGAGSFVGLAIHAGHELRSGLRSAIAIDDKTRLREEDPFTEQIAALCGTSIVTFRSRFEVDLNRPADEAICVHPEDCWNLSVWKEQDGLTQTMYRRSLAEHTAFYEMLGALLREIEAREGRFVVLDCHSYNHRRAGPDAPPADPQTNPEINIGTGSMDRDHWAPLVDSFIASLRAADCHGRHLDVRENVKFRGRHLTEFVHMNFPKTGCCLAIEVKKFFMDEWTGELDDAIFGRVLDAFRNALDDVEGEPWTR